jgi:hypothetical protein
MDFALHTKSSNPYGIEHCLNIENLDEFYKKQHVLYSNLYRTLSKIKEHQESIEGALDKQQARLDRLLAAKIIFVSYDKARVRYHDSNQGKDVYRTVNKRTCEVLVNGKAPTAQVVFEIMLPKIVLLRKIDELLVYAQAPDTESRPRQTDTQANLLYYFGIFEKQITSKQLLIESDLLGLQSPINLKN